MRFTIEITYTFYGKYFILNGLLLYMYVVNMDVYKDLSFLNV